MAKAIEWKKSGWTCIQEADAKKHILEISCYVQDGNVTKVVIRHNDGEEQIAKVIADGKNVLPISTADFEAKFNKGELTFN